MKKIYSAFLIPCIIFVFIFISNASSINNNGEPQNRENVIIGDKNTKSGVFESILQIENNDSFKLNSSDAAIQAITPGIIEWWHLETNMAKYDPDDWWNPFDSYEAWGEVITEVGAVEPDEIDELAALSLKLSSKCTLYKNGTLFAPSPTSQNYTTSSFSCTAQTKKAANCSAGDVFDNTGYHSVWNGNVVQVSETTESTVTLP